MVFKTKIEPYTLQFIKPAGTSRGVYQIRKVWFVRISSVDAPGRFGIGECAPLPDLSCDALPDYEEILQKACLDFENTGKIDYEGLRPYPSILFGLETALRHFEQGSFALWDTSFSRGEAGIPINGLIWMGTFEEMSEQIEDKIKLGFKCIKLKIGAINFEKELELIRQIRQRFSPEIITLRVDANGGFSPQDAPSILALLSELGLHSIEQPIQAGLEDEMAKLTATTPLPIALDEELIGCNLRTDKRLLLQKIKPQYIILKPSLHGGFKGCAEWIDIAEELKIGWWITSALESNIGLNAIAQWTATLENPMHQGLGTGLLYSNNVEMPLEIIGDKLFYNINNQYLEQYYLNDIFKSETQSITIEGQTFSVENLHEELKKATDFRLELVRFLIDWFSPSEEIRIHTSGSTGMPKSILVEKIFMRRSALLTCSFLGLKALDKILLCMPLSFIAGKMMVVRAVMAGLDLYPVAPTGHPLSDTDQSFRFASMVPLQIFNSLQNPMEENRLRKVSILLIGGGVISPSLENILKDFPNEVYASYGMAETVSHIALRRVNGPQASLKFSPLPSVQISLSEDNSLVIDAPMVSSKRLYTNDQAEIFRDGTFRILGRNDNVIVTGGLKVQAESLEETLSTIIEAPFAITSLPDPKFGEIIVLVVEKPFDEALLSAHLPAYQVPKKVILLDTIPLTESGKIDRTKLRNLIL